MSEPGGDGVAARSTKHSARQDDQLAHETEDMIRAGRPTRAEEWKAPEPVAEGEPDIDRFPEGPVVGGVPVGTTPDAVVARAELARWLERHDFPATGPELVEAARDHRAPDGVADQLARLPDGETYQRIGDVVRALGYPTET